MTDIFREVEEEVRRERFENLWKHYGDYIIAGAAVIAIAVASYELWARYETNARLKASASYNAATQLAVSGDINGASAAFAKLAKDAPSGYALLSHLAEADAKLSAGDLGDAVALYKSIAAGKNATLGDVARIREAWAIVDFTAKPELETLLAPLTNPASPWKYIAREVLAYADYRAGQMALAQKEFETLASDAQAPTTLRQRCQAMSIFLGSSGGKEYGTVPPLKPAAPSAAGADAKPGSAPQ